MLSFLVAMMIENDFYVIKYIMYLIMIVCTDIPESFNTYEHFIPVFDYKITVLNSQHKISIIFYFRKNIGKVTGGIEPASDTDDDSGEEEGVDDDESEGGESSEGSDDSESGMFV